MHRDAPAPPAGSALARFTAVMRPGEPMSAATAAVDAANPRAQLIDVGAKDLGRLCKWLGSSTANAAFNALQKYVLTESARYCPAEDHQQSSTAAKTPM